MYSGSCLCSAVHYEVRGEIGAGFFCHCSRCRKANGAAFAASAIVASKDFVVTQGESRLKSFSSSPGDIAFSVARAVRRLSVVAMPCRKQFDYAAPCVALPLASMQSSPWRVEDKYRGRLG